MTTMLTGSPRWAGRSVRPSCLPWFLPAAWLFAPAGTSQNPVPQWRSRHLEARDSHAMAYDMARQRTVLFGGLDGSLARDDTWEWDGVRWSQRTSTAHPAARYAHAMAYDAARRRTVLFGGASVIPNPMFADTWEWDGATWSQRAPIAGPPARAGHAMAYDTARQVTVLFGGWGISGNPYLAETWEWDGTTWRQRTPAVSPGPSAGVAMAYDVVRQRTVLYGGGNNFSRIAETWEWDGTNWTQRTFGTGPPARSYHALVYDPVRNRTLLFGGNPAAGLADTWEWDGFTWLQRATGPPGRGFHAMAYDVARQRSVLFGGTSPGVRFADTWEWDGSAWVERSTRVRPDAYGCNLAYDVGRQRTVWFGGGLNLTPNADTFEWDGFDWLQRTPATSPPARTDHALAFDAARQHTVLFGGVNAARVFADTWVWDGSNWTMRATSGPPPRIGHALAYDNVRQRTVLFGGTSSSYPSADTWEWDGTSWLARAPATRPPARSEHAMAFDSVRRRTVLFGGQDVNGRPFADTWEWDGTNWVQLLPAISPTGVSRHGMAFDIHRQRIVLTAYYGGAGRSDTWEWDGTSWVMTASAPSQSAPTGRAMAYDMQRRQVVIWNSATWVYGVVASTRSFGNGCGGASGPPTLSSNEPHLGNPSFRLDLSSALASSPCVFGISPTGQVLQVGSCTLYLRELTTLLPTTTSALGFASTTLPIPMAPTLIGATIYTQAFVADPQAPVLGIAFSAGLRLVLGS